jgi:two-component system, chemotaxis family, sensor kinase CheA
MSSATEARLLGIFREEAGERLDRIVEALLAIDADSPPADATDLLFREFHSLKGGAGLVGLEPMRDLAHAVEEQLGEFRRAGRPLPRKLAAELLSSADALRGLLDDAPAADAAPPAEPADGAPAEAASTPAADHSIRVSATKVDRVLDTVGSAVLHQRGLEHLLGAGARADEGIEEALDRGATLLEELQDAAIELRALPLSAITGPFARHVRDLAVAEGKEVDLHLHGVETQLDRTILDGLSDMLVHLLRNAVAHGIEPPREREAAGKPARGRVELRAEQRGARIAIEVCDDGRGVAADVLRDAADAGAGDGALLELLARPGFSTAERVSDVAGRGVGLDAVKAHVESLGGSVEVHSAPGRGTTIALLLPLTLAILHVLLVERRGQPFGLPLASVEEIVVAEQTTSLGGRPSIALRGEAIPLGDLAVALGGVAGSLPERPPALVVRHGAVAAALACDRLLGEEDVVVKRLGPLLERRPGYLGGAILGDGRVALIADPAVAVERAVAAGGGALATADGEPANGAAPSARKVLVVDDQFTVRELQRSILEAAGYRVTTAVDGLDALQQLQADGAVDAIVTDLEMPQLDGIELLRRVREEPALASLPVVVVTSLSGESDRRRGLDAGADAYVTKDRFDQRALLDTVERLIGR